MVRTKDTIMISKYDLSMIRSALIIVPHPDDEINVAGGLFETLQANGIYTSVAICTNGDHVPEFTAKRIREAQKAQRIFKYQELIFLGYGDGYRGTHIYDSKEGDAVESYCGKKETYCAGNTKEYCCSKTGKHHSYIRGNYKKDIKALINEKKADLIVCVDLDKHSDHKCVSLLFDECMGEILKRDCNYRPIILKAFAYNGVWFGPYDYFDTILKQTSIKLSAGDTIEEKCFPYNWEDRIRIRNSRNISTLYYWKNPIFKALLAHRTQSDYYKLRYCALQFFPKIANPDSCYWYRSPYNIVLYSQITVSSGDGHYLNDFMLAKPKNAINDILPINSEGWSPDINDKEPTIEIAFPRQICLKEIKIYQNYNSARGIIKIQLEGKDEMEYLCTNDNVQKIAIPSVLTQKLFLQFVSGGHIIINEIECYESNSDFPWQDVPFSKYEHRVVQRNMILAKSADFSYRIFIRSIKLFSKWKAILNKGGNNRKNSVISLE